MAPNPHLRFLYFVLEDFNRVVHSNFLDTDLQKTTFAPSFLRELLARASFETFTLHSR